MQAPRLRVSQRMRDLMSYAKLSGPVPRVLVLRGEYWLDGACVNAARQMGWKVAEVPAVMQGVMSREQVADFLQALTEFRPDFVLSVNMTAMDREGVLARLFEDLRIPYVAWFVDNPRTILMGERLYASAYTVALTWEKAYLPYLRELGFPLVYALPLAVDATVFNAEPADSWNLPPTFVGNSMVAYAERTWEQVAARPGLAQAVVEAFESGRVTRANFGKGIRAILGPSKAEQLDAEAARHAEMYFFIEGTRRLRHDLVRLLEPEGLCVRGDEEWRRSFPNAGGPVNYFAELPVLYRRCEVNVNTTSIQMPNAVNQRVFDCPAAGGFLLTDAQASLRELFDVEHEIAAYASWDECRDMFRYYRSRPAARREVAQRARRRVLAEHTYVHRLQTLAAIIKEHFRL